MDAIPIPDGIEPDDAFRFNVRINGFDAKADDGGRVCMLTITDEWMVDYYRYSWGMLIRDLNKRVNWGKDQDVVVVTVSGKQMRIENNMDLILAMAARFEQKFIDLNVSVEDKCSTKVSRSVVSEMVCESVAANSHAKASTSAATTSSSWQVSGSVVVDVGHGLTDIVPSIDWDSLQLEPIPEAEIGSALPIVSKDQVYALVGLKADDEKAERDRKAAENAPGEPIPTIDYEGAALVVNDVISDEPLLHYDTEDPPMTEGSIYPCMDDFRLAVRHHAIIGEFELGTEKSDTNRFRGYCAAEGCPWAIVARLMDDGKSVRVTLNSQETLNLDGW